MKEKLICENLILTLVILKLVNSLVQCKAHIKLQVELRQIIMKLEQNSYEHLIFRLEMELEIIILNIQ